MIAKNILLLGAVWLALNNCPAEVITTIDGKKVENVTNVTVRAEGLIIKIDTTNANRSLLVPLDKLPDNLKRKYYRYDPFEAGLLLARKNEPTQLTLDSAFRLNNLEAAKAKGKLLGFVMVWDQFFRSAKPMGQYGNAGLSHFYTAFNKGLVLVFVRHEDELDKVPDSVKQGFGGPDEGGWAPNMAVVSGDCSEYICEIPLGGKESNGQIREKIFREKIAVIKKFLSEHDAAKTKAAEAAKTK